MTKEKAIEVMTSLLNHIGLSRKDFSISIGIENPQWIADILNANKKVGISKEKSLKICSTYPEINRDWLMTGEGEMLRRHSADELPKEMSNEASEQSISIKEYCVPLIPTAALANSLSEYIGPGIRKIDCQTILSPVPGAEVAITISGDSMEPKFQDGMIVFLKRINESAFIPWGNTLVLDTENGAFIKNVFPCEGDESMIEARSINPLYPTMRIPKTSVFGMYRVLNATKFFTTM